MLYLDYSGPCKKNLLGFVGTMIMNLAQTYDCWPHDLTDS